jgi:hypothetical protein
MIWKDLEKGDFDVTCIRRSHEAGVIRCTTQDDSSHPGTFSLHMMRLTDLVVLTGFVVSLICGAVFSGSHTPPP